MYLIRTEVIDRTTVNNITVATSNEYTRPLTDDEDDILDLFKYIGEMYEGDLYDSNFGCEYEDFTDFYLNSFNDRSIERVRDRIIVWYEGEDELTNSKLKELNELWEKCKPIIEKLKQEGWERFIY